MHTLLRFQRVFIIIIYLFIFLWHNVISHLLRNYWRYWDAVWYTYSTCVPAWKDVFFIDLGQLGQGHLRSPKVEPFDFEILFLICGGRSHRGCGSQRCRAQARRENAYSFRLHLWSLGYGLVKSMHFQCILFLDFNAFLLLLFIYLFFFGTMLFRISSETIGDIEMPFGTRILHACQHGKTYFLLT